MQYRELGRTGLHLSIIGFGASPLGNEFGPIAGRDGERAVAVSLESGINLFDTSPFYGRGLSEERLGVALAGHRDHVVLATKVGRYGKDEFDFSASRVHRSIDESLRRLRTDRVDLLTAHDIEFGDLSQVIHETLPAMERLREAGKTRFVGVSGFPVKSLLRAVREAHIDYVLSYCRFNLLVRDLDTKLLPTLRERGAGLINASPLHMGLLTPNGGPDWHPAPFQVQRKGEELLRWAEERRVDLPSLALRFSIEHSHIAATLVGFSSQAQVEAAVRALYAPLDRELMNEIDTLVARVRDIIWASGRPENSDV